MGRTDMNLWVGSGLIVTTAALLYIFVEQKPADVYDMPPAQAYSLLANVTYEPLNEGARAAGIERATKGNGSDKVTWITQGSHVYRECTLQLGPFEDDAARTKVTVQCGGGGAGEGAAAGMAHNLHRNNVIERIDATLTGRPYDLGRAGATASRWPGDGVDGSFRTAAKTAIEMDREVREMQASSSQAQTRSAVDSDTAMEAFYAE